MPANRDIRDRYTEIIGHLVREHGSAVSGYEISKDAPLAQCIGYARRFIVGRANDEPHYRYNRYMDLLKPALRQQSAIAGRMVHVDIGCGPGLFMWVVRDCFRPSSKIDVEYYGYDHAKDMARLAKIIWNRLEEGVRYSFYHSIRDLESNMELATADRRNVLVTLGHVLVQTVDNDSALDDFARIIAKCARMANCLVIAVDARTGERPMDFRRALGKLKASLERRGLTISVPPVGASDAVTSVRRTSWA